MKPRYETQIKYMNCKFDQKMTSIKNFWNMKAHCDINEFIISIDKIAYSIILR